MNEGPANHERAAAQRREAAEIRVGWKMAAIGMEVAAQVAGGALLGWAIDSIFSTSWGVLTGAIVGLAVGMWTLIKGSLKLNKQLEALGPRPRNLARPAAEATASGESDSDDDEIPSWREDWETWKEGDELNGDDDGGNGHAEQIGPR